MLGQLLGGQTQQQNQGRKWSSDRREFDENQFMDSDVSLSGNGFEQIGEVKVGADQKIEFGQGDRSLDPMEQGRPYHYYDDGAGNQVKGTVRFLHVSAQEGTVHKIRDISTRSLNESTTSERETMPRASKPSQPGDGKPAATQDAFIRMKIKVSNYSALTNKQISLSASTIEQPVTVWELN